MYLLEGVYVLDGAFSEITLDPVPPEQLDLAQLSFNMTCRLFSFARYALPIQLTNKALRLLQSLVMIRYMLSSRKNQASSFGTCRAKAKNVRNWVNVVSTYRRRKSRFNLGLGLCPNLLPMG